MGDVDEDSKTYIIPTPMPRPSKRKNSGHRAALLTAAQAAGTSAETPAALPRPALSASASLIQAKPKPQTFNRASLRKKTSTELLCELTRLKAQQKYLECNQAKFNPKNFQDIPPQLASVLAVSTSLSSSLYEPSNGNGHGHGNGNSNGNSTSPTEPPTSELINEIEQLKIDLNSELLKHRETARKEVSELRQLVNTICEDVRKPERLRLISLPNIRERIIGINKQFEQLRDKNASRLDRLQQESLQFDRGIKFRKK